MKKADLLSEIVDNECPIEDAFHLMSDQDIQLIVVRYNSAMKQYNLGLISYVEKDQMIAKVWYDLLELTYRVGNRQDYTFDEVYALHLIEDKWFFQLEPITKLIPTTKFEAERIKPLLFKTNENLWIKNPDIPKKGTLLDKISSFFSPKVTRKDHFPWG